MAVTLLASVNSSQSFSIVPQNDTPIVDLNGATAGVNNSVSWTETANANSTAVSICSNATLSDIDNNNLSQITLALTGLVNGNSEVLTISGVNFLLGTDYSSTTAGAFSVSYSTSTGLLTILPGSGATFTMANAQTLLRGITYNNTTHNPTVTPNRVISITVTDAGDDNIGGSNKTISLVATSTISLTAVNDAPAVTAVTIAYTDTVIDDTFTNTIGTLTASDAETNRNDLRFALVGSSTVSYSSGGVTYDLSKSNSYGVFICSLPLVIIFSSQTTLPSRLGSPMPPKPLVSPLPTTAAPHRPPAPAPRSPSTSPAWMTRI